MKAQLGGGSTSSASGGAGGGAGAGAAASSSTSDGYAPKGSGAADGRHHDLLIQELARELSCDPDQIVDFELCLYDTQVHECGNNSVCCVAEGMPALSPLHPTACVLWQRSAIGGPRREFVYAPRLDNLLMSFCGLEVGLLLAKQCAHAWWHAHTRTSLARACWHPATWLRTWLLILTSDCWHSLTMRKLALAP